MAEANTSVDPGRNKNRNGQAPQSSRIARSHVALLAASIAVVALAVALVSSMPALLELRDDVGLGTSFVEENLTDAEIAASLDDPLAALLPATSPDLAPSNDQGAGK